MQRLIRNGLLFLVKHKANDSQTSERGHQHLLETVCSRQEWERRDCKKALDWSYEFICFFHSLNCPVCPVCIPICVTLILTHFEVEGAHHTVGGKKEVAHYVLVERNTIQKGIVAGYVDTANNNISRFGDRGVYTVALDRFDLRYFALTKHVTNTHFISTNGLSRFQ